MKLLAIALILATATTAAADSEPQRLYREGQAAYDGGRFDDAVLAWKKSYELSHLPGLLFNLGQAYRKRAWAGDCAKSVDSYKQFVALDPKSTQRPTAEGFIAELGSCATSERPAEPVKPTPPPPQTDRPPPPAASTDRGHTKRMIGLGLFGATGVFGLTAAYFGHRATSIGDEVTAACASGCTFADVAARDREGRSAQTKEYGFLGLASAAAVAGVVVYWLGTTERSHVIVLPTTGGGAVSWSGRW